MSFKKKSLAENANEFIVIVANLDLSEEKMKSRWVINDFHLDILYFN